MDMRAPLTILPLRLNDVTFQVDSRPIIRGISTTIEAGMRTIILALSVGMLIFLYSQYVLLAIVITYILYGLLSRMVGVFWRRSDASEAKIEANPGHG